MNIEISMDSVVIEGQTVKRPAWFGRKQWLDTWESLVAIKKHYCEHCGATIQQ